MKIDSYETAISAWKSLLDNRFFDATKAKFILYMDKHNEAITAGWTWDYQIPKLNNICTYVFVDKERISTLTEKEYYDFVEALKLKNKQKKYNAKLKELEKDFL